MSESLRRLRSDAKWWLAHSAGRVNIVLLVWIRPAAKAITIEKWILGSPPVTRTSARLARSYTFPTRTAEIKIDQSQTPPRIVGAPLILEFHKVFDRPAVAPLEGDIEFSSQDLDDWATSLWVGL
jgi:hypothetical protein